MRRKIKTAKDLKRWRERRGISQEAAAPIFHRTKRMLQYIEAGKTKRFHADIDMFAKIYEDQAK